mgnify:CR=1 FL=1
MSTAAEQPRRGLGRGPRGPDRRRDRAGARAPARRDDPSESAPAQAAVRCRGNDGACRLDQARRAIVQPVRRAAARGGRLRADRRRAPLARGAARPARRRFRALVRETDDRDTLLLGIVENVAREQLSPVEEARAYALLIDEFGLSLGEIGRARRSLEPGDLEPRPPARAFRRRARHGRARRADRWSRARCPRCSGQRGPATACPRDRHQGPNRPRRGACGALGRGEAEAAPGAGRRRSIPLWPSESVSRASAQRASARASRRRGSRSRSPTSTSSPSSRKPSSARAPKALSAVSRPWRGPLNL